MKRRSVALDPETAGDLERTAQRLDRSPAWVIRRAIRRYAREVETGRREREPEEP